MNFCLAKINKRFCVSLILDISGRYLDMSQFGQQYTKERLGAMPASSALSSLLPPPLLGNIWPDTCYHKFISFAAKIWRVGVNTTTTPPLQLHDYNSIETDIRNSWPHFHDKVGILSNFRRTRLIGIQTWCVLMHIDVLQVGGWSFVATFSFQLANFFVEIYLLRGEEEETCSAWGAGRLDWHNVIDVMMGMMEDVRHHSGGPMISLKIIIHDVCDFIFIFHY